MDKIKLDLHKKLPISLRNPFWNSLMGAVEDELQLIQKKIEEKRTLLSYRDSSLDNLLDLMSMFLILPKETFENIRILLRESYGMTEEEIQHFLKKELYKLPFNYKEKGTFSFYRTLFSTFGFSFTPQISMYKEISQTARLIREIEDPLGYITDIPLIYGFEDDAGDFLTDGSFTMGFARGTRPSILKQQSKNNFSGTISVPQILDNGEFVEDPVDPLYRFSEELNMFVFDPENGTHNWVGLSLDDNLFLDTIDTDSFVLTKHVGFEVELNFVIIKNFIPYLIPYEVFQYLYASVYFYKRQTEVPHVGAQLTVLLDKTGYWDTFSDEVITQNVIPIPDFSRDYIWQKGEGWFIQEGRAEYTTTPTFPPTNPSNLPLLQTAFILPGMSLEDLINRKFKSIPTGTQVRLTIHVEELESYPFDFSLPTLYVFTVDNNSNFKRTLFEIRTPGVHTIDVLWLEDEMTVINIASLTSVKISRMEAIPFERFSVPEARCRGAMKKGISYEGILSIDYFQFGMGGQKLPSRNDPVYEFPVGLEKPLAMTIPIDEGVDTEKYDTEFFTGAIAQYIGQLVNGFPILPLPLIPVSSVDGVLPEEIRSFRRGTLVLGVQDITNPLDFPILLRDDTMGNLVGSMEGLTGTIDYKTGVFHIEFPEEMQAPKGIVLHEVYINSPTLVTEVGVYGRTLEKPTEIQLLAYLTFAPVELVSNAFHFNMGVILEK